MRLRSQRGIAIIVTMIFMTAGFLGFSTYVTLGSSHLNANNLTLKFHKAFYLAEAAVEDAKARLRDDFSTFPVSGDGTVFSFGGGEYYFNVNQTSDPTEQRITAYGAVPDFANAEATKVVEVVFKRNPAYLFDYALYSSGNVKLESSSTVTGDLMGGINFVMEGSTTTNGNITVGGDVDLKGSATVNGDIAAGGSINCEGSSCGQISGTQTENANVSFVEPALDLDELKGVAQGQSYNGHDNYYLASEIDPENPPFPSTFYETPPSGGDPGVPWVVFIEGDLKLENTVIAGGFIVINGKGIFESSSGVNGVIYAASGEVKVEGSASLDGSVITANGATVKFESSSQLTWNSAYADAIKAQSYGEQATLSQLSWNEKAP